MECLTVASHQVVGHLMVTHLKVKGYLKVTGQGHDLEVKTGTHGIVLMTVRRLQVSAYKFVNYSLFNNHILQSFSVIIQKYFI